MAQQSTAQSFLRNYDCCWMNHFFFFEWTQCQVPRRGRMSWQKNSEKSKWMSAGLKPVDFSLFDEILPLYSAFIVRCEGKIINHFQHYGLLTISELDEGSSIFCSIKKLPRLSFFFLNFSYSTHPLNLQQQQLETIEWLKRRSKVSF